MTAAEISLGPLGHAALGLASRGFRVFPIWELVDGVCACPKEGKCDRPGKHPKVRRGLWEGTTDAGRITSWWLDWPEANVGIRTGVDLFVVDLDGDAGKATWSVLCEQWGLAVDTLRAITGGGGEHLLFKGTGKTTVGQLGRGVDTRGEGGYIVAPPSMHASGRRYRWDEEGTPEMAELPAVVRDAAGQPRPVPPGESADTYIHGGRNKALTSMAGAMRRRGASGEDILVMLLALNAHRCKPPLEEPEVKRIALSVARYPPASEATREGAGADGEGHASKAVRLMALVEQWPVVQSPTGRFFAEVDGAAVPLDGKAWLAWVSAQYQSKWKGIVSGGLVKDTTNVLQGRPQRSAEVPLRVGERDGVAWLDLGPEAGAVPLAEVDDDALPPAFHRPSGTLPLPAPEAGGAADIEELRGFLGFEHGHLWTCCLAWLLATLRAAAPYPILFLQGEADSGKSTLGEILRSLVDPRGLESLGLPRGAEALRNLAIQAEHNHVLAYDNLSSLDGELSDAFCRIATGDGFAIRSLYSDRDLVVFRAARPVLFTSIVDALVRPDLLSRSLIAQLPVRAIEGGRRVTPGELRAGVAARAPRVLGALVAAARSSRPVEVPSTVRMGGPCAFAAGAEEQLGLPPGSVVAAYLTSRGKAHEVEAGDPLVEALLEYLRPGTQVRVTYRQLLDRLGELAWGEARPPAWWPTHGKALQAQLRRHAGLLRASKVTVEVVEEGHDKTRILHLRRLK
jgi:hypothetical protein